MSWLDKLRGRGAAAASSGAAGPGASGVSGASAPTPTPALAPALAEVRAVEVSRAPVGDGDELVTAAGSARPVLLDSADAAILRGAWPFRSIEVHARALEARVALPREAIEARLARLCALGLLASRREVASAIAARAVAEDVPAPAQVGVLTCDRPDALARALTSHRGVLPTSVALCVYDDSARPEVRAVNRAHARAAGARYAGLEEKRAYAERLAARAGEVSAAQVLFLLGLAEDAPPGARTGGNHNVGLLDAVGAPFVSVDDDTTARLSPAGAPGLALTAAHDPTAFRFFADRAAALAAAALAPADVTAVHGALLGRAVASLVAVDTDAVDLDPAGAALLHRLAARGGRVRVTSLGVAGDSGMGTPSYALTLGEPSRASLFADYAAHRRTRAVVRAVDRPTVSAGTFLMAPSLGLDARAVLPPFMPYGRNQDGAYAALLRALLPEAYLGHLPRAVEHAPLEPREFSADAPVRGGARVLFADILMWALEAAALGELRGDARFAAMGAHLSALGQLAPAELHAWCVAQRAARVAQQLARLHAAADAPPEDAPDEWRRDVGALAEHLRAAAQDGERALPMGWVEALGADGARARVGAYLRALGEGVALWPRVWAAAGALAAEGVRPSTTA